MTADDEGVLYSLGGLPVRVVETLPRPDDLPTAWVSGTTPALMSRRDASDL